MYCSQCEAYIPEGIGIVHCPSCNIDIAVGALPIEKKIEASKAVSDEPQHKLMPTNTYERIIPDSDYNCFQGLFYSFFSPHFFIDVVNKWKGYGFIFLTLLSLVFSFAVTFSFMKQYDIAQNEHILPVISHVPRMGIADGKLLLAEKSPHVIRNASGELNLAVFDNTGSNTSTFQVASMFLFTLNKLIINDRNGGENSSPYPIQLDIKLNSEIVYYFFDQLQRWLPFLLYPVACLVAVVSLILIAFLFSIIALLIDSLAKTYLKYSTLFRLSAVALGPSVMISSFFMLMLKDMDERTVLIYLLTTGYLIFGIASVGWHRKKEEAERIAAEIKKTKEKKYGSLFH